MLSLNRERPSPCRRDCYCQRLLLLLLMLLPPLLWKEKSLLPLTLTMTLEMRL